MVFAVVLAVAVPDQGSTGWEPDFIRHCERSEAIHSCEESVDCFVATLLAMTAVPIRPASAAPTLSIRRNRRRATAPSWPDNP